MSVKTVEEVSAQVPPEDFQALEDKVYRTIELYKAAKDVPAANAGSGSNSNSVRVEIFDQVYNLRGSDADYILKLAEYVDAKMRAVSEQTATVDSVRLAVLAALNIADEYHLLKRGVE